MKIDSWKGCYPSNWKGMIVPDAIAYPAKFSSKLIRRIYGHMKAEGWVKPGDTVVDPFGGVALGALDAMRLGLRWFGVELEPRFVKLGNKNIQLWYRRFSSMPIWNGDAILLNGDSRELVKVLKEAGALDPRSAVSSPPFVGCFPQNDPNFSAPHDSTHNLQAASRGYSGANVAVSSPPYADVMNSGKTGIDWSKAKDGRDCENEPAFSRVAGEGAPMGYSSAVVSSPPYADGCAHTGGDTPISQEHTEGGKINLPGISGVVSSPPYAEARIGSKSGQEQCGRGDQYGATPGQLGAMKANGFEAAISSPPYAGTPVEKNSKSIDRPKQYEIYKKSGGGQSFEAFCHTQELHSQGYGNSEGQLSAMKPGDFDAAISSPPFRQTSGGTNVTQKEGYLSDPNLFARHAAGNAALEGYGKTEGQLANTDENDFWAAARQIVDQVYQVLVPGGHAVWVCKDFVKAKQIVPFCDQWRQMCEAAGFATLHEHRALLVHSTATDFDGKEKRRESKSFFRRLAENKGSPRIDYETVYCMEKL